MHHWKMSNAPLSRWYDWNSEDSNSDIDSLNGTSPLESGDTNPAVKMYLVSKYEIKKFKWFKYPFWIEFVKVWWNNQLIQQVFTPSL